MNLVCGSYETKSVRAEVLTVFLPSNSGSATNRQVLVCRIYSTATDNQNGSNTEFAAEQSKNIYQELQSGGGSDVVLPVMR